MREPAPEFCGEKFPFHQDLFAGDHLDHKLRLAGLGSLQVRFANERRQALVLAGLGEQRGDGLRDLRETDQGFLVCAAFFSAVLSSPGTAM